MHLKGTPSEDAIIIFETFALVVGLMVIGMIFLIVGSTSINDLGTLKRLSFLFFVLTAGFFVLPDLMGFLKGDLPHLFL